LLSILQGSGASARGAAEALLMRERVHSPADPDAEQQK